MSTSLVEEVEPELKKKFATGLEHGRILMKIKVPKGEGRGMYVARYSEYPDQCEFILGRGTDLKITNIIDEGNGNYTCECEYNGQTKDKLSQLKVQKQDGSTDEPYAHQTIYVEPHTQNTKTEQQLVAEFENLPESEQMKYSDFTTYAKAHYYVSDYKCSATTAQAYTDENKKFTQERIDKVHKPIVKKILDSGDTPPAGQKPIAVFVGGGAGSGKSSVSRHLLEPVVQQTGVRFASLDADEIKEEIPELHAMYKQYKGTAHQRVHTESQAIQRRAFTEILKNKKCFIQQGIMGSVSAYNTMIDKAIEAGYEVKVLGVDVPISEAVKRASFRARVMKESTITRGHQDFASGILQIAQHPGVSSFQLYDNSQPAGQAPTCMFDSSIGVLDQNLCNRFLTKGDGTQSDLTKLIKS